MPRYLISDDAGQKVISAESIDEASARAEQWAREGGQTVWHADEVDDLGIYKRGGEHRSGEVLAPTGAERQE